MKLHRFALFLAAFSCTPMLARAQSDSSSVDRFFGYLDRNQDGNLDGDELRRIPGPVRDALKRARVDVSRGVSKQAFDSVAPRAMEDMRREREYERQREDERRRERESEERLERQQREADRLVKFYTDLDKDGDKIIDPEELAQSRYRRDVERRLREAGFDPGKPVPLSAFMSKRLERAGLDSGYASKLARKGFTPPKQRYSATDRERVTVDLPTQYSTGDTNLDGQITLAEWRLWKGRAALRQFALIDRNGDGFLTPRELLLPIPDDPKQGTSSRK